MTLPLQSPIAFSKFFVEPRVCSLTNTRTGKAAWEANLLMIAIVSSVEWSSHTMSSSVKRVCVAMLASCSGRNRAPLNVHKAMEIRGLCIASHFRLAQRISSNKLRRAVV